MNKWYLFLNGVETDPFFKEQIRQMFDNHLLDADTLTRRMNSPQWVELKKDPDLLSLLSNQNEVKYSELPFVQAVLDHNSDQLQVTCPKCGQHYRVDKNVKTGSLLLCQKCETKFSLLNPVQAEGVSPDIPFKTPAREKNESVDFSEKTIEGDITCPHCWKTFSAGDVLYISMHPDLLGDSLLGSDAQKRFTPTVYNSQGIPLDAYEMACTDIACPHCHLQIPSSILDMDSLYFSIVGAPSSGKSYFLTSLVHQLRKNLPEYAECSFADVDPRINRTINVYENMMFMAVEKVKVVTLTKTEEVGLDFSDQTIMNGLPVYLPKPFIFQIVPLSKNDADSKGFRKNIIFYDNAGEHFEPGRENVSNPATLHLAHSNAIIFIFDPINDSEMRQICNQSDPQFDDTKKVSNQTVLFSEMVSRIRRHANMTMSQKSSIPLILAVGKYDLWEDCFEEKLREKSPFVFNPESMDMDFDSDILYSVSFSLREFIQRYAPGIVAQAETFFETVIFVPVSSFGTLAEVSEHKNVNGNSAVGIMPSKLNPVWSDIPFFALMDYLGILHEKKSDKKDAILLQVKKSDEKLIFAHPITHHRIQLPLNYAGHCITIGGKLYQIPVLNKNTYSAKTKTDYWS